MVAHTACCIACMENNGGGSDGPYCNHGISLCATSNGCHQLFYAIPCLHREEGLF